MHVPAFSVTEIESRGGRRQMSDDRGHTERAFDSQRSIDLFLRYFDLLVGHFRPCHPIPTDEASPNECKDFARASRRNTDIGPLTLSHRVVMAPLTRLRSKIPGDIPWALPKLVPG
jgi:hypothetical protein